MKPAELYIFKQPEPFKSILMHLHLIVEHTCPEIELKYKYKIPFYYIYGKPFCYFNASHKNKYVDVGFVKGQAIMIHKNHLISKNRKKMVSLRYTSFESIDDSILIDVLYYAKRLY